MDIDWDLSKINRISRALEPLVVLYEQTVLEAGKEPFEVWLQIQQSTYLSDNNSPFGPVHFIDGETLQAAYKVWQHLYSLERRLANSGEGQ